MDLIVFEFIYRCIKISVPTKYSGAFVVHAYMAQSVAVRNMRPNIVHTTLQLAWYLRSLPHIWGPINSLFIKVN